ncbi:hypothetical protein Tco_0807460 [Tanacetum coccineum]
MEGSEQSHSVPSGTVHDPQDLKRNLQLASTGLPSTLDEGTRKSQPLPEGTTSHPKYSGGNDQPFDRDLTSTTSDDGMAKSMSRPEGSLGDKDSEGNIPPADMEPIHTTVADLSGTASRIRNLYNYKHLLMFKLPFFLMKNWLESDEEEVLAVGEDMDEDPQVAEEVRTPSPKKDHPESSNVQESTSNSSSPDLKKFDNILPITERQLIKYLKKMSKVLFKYYDENVAHRDQTDKLVETTMSTIDRSSTTIKDLYQGMHVITKLPQDIHTAVKDDPAINKKINESIETFAKISTHTTKVLSLVKAFDFSTLQSAMNDLQAHSLKQEETSAAWTKSSTKKAWNLGSRMTAIKISQTALKNEAFKGQSSSTPSGSVNPTLALTHIPANVEGENDPTNTATEDPPSHTEGETDASKQDKLISSSKPQLSITQAQPITIINPEPIIPQREGKGIATYKQMEDQRQLVKDSSIIRPDPDEEVKVPYMINRKMYYLTDKEMQAYLDKEEQLKKAAEEARLLAISKPEVIKVVQEEAKKIRLDPKIIASAKACQKFKKAHDAEHEVLKR